MYPERVMRGYLATGMHTKEGEVCFGKTDRLISTRIQRFFCCRIIPWTFLFGKRVKRGLEEKVKSIREFF